MTVTAGVGDEGDCEAGGDCLVDYLIQVVTVLLTILYRW